MRQFSLAVLFLLLPFVTACSSSIPKVSDDEDVQGSYEVCVEETLSSVDSSDLPKDMRAQFEEQTREMALSSCKTVVSVCEKDRSGAICEKMLEQYQS